MLESVLIVLLKRKLVVCGADGWQWGWIVRLELQVLIAETNITTLETKWKHLGENKLGHKSSVLVFFDIFYLVSL